MTQIKVIQFMKQRKYAAAFSALLILGSIVSLVVNGLQFGLDFTGGTQLEIGFEKSVNLEAIRKNLDEQKLKNPLVVYYGADSEVLIRMQGSLKDIALEQLKSSLSKQFGSDVSLTPENVAINNKKYAAKLLISGATNLDSQIETFFPKKEFVSVETHIVDDNSVEVMLATSLETVVSSRLLSGLEAATGQKASLRRSEFVGPQVGDELRDDGGLGMLFALFVVMAYVALRFQFKFSVGAVAALIHDVIIVIGTFSLFKLDFDLTVLAAVLAVIGYSLNDTIVVSDRIRENFRKLRKGNVEEVIDLSLTQTLGRTLITSLTTLLVLIALFVFGGELIHGFATALVVGVMVGTYSSIYVAANVLVFMGISKEDLVVPEKEGAELDGMP